MIRDYQAIQKTWFLKGKQRKIPTHGKHRGAKLIGCLNYETGEILCQEKETYDAVAFQEFLLHVLNHYPEGKIVIILDNARIHHAKLLTPFLRQPSQEEDLGTVPHLRRSRRWPEEPVLLNIPQLRPGFRAGKNFIAG